MEQYKMVFSLWGVDVEGYPFGGQILGRFAVSGDDFKDCMAQAWDIKEGYDKTVPHKTVLMIVDRGAMNYEKD